MGTYPSSCSGAADGNYDISYAAGTVTVGQATPTVTVSGQSGQVTGPVTITVTVSGSPGASDPTGPVTVSDENNRCSITSLDASGSGSCALVENASENGKAVTASYSGDTNYTSASGTTTESVQPAVPKVTLSGPSSAITGWITYSVTVSGNGAQPTGSVVISDGTSSCQAVFAAGLWSCPLQETTGTYQLTATYGGDSNYASTTGSASEVVNESPDLAFGVEPRPGLRSRGDGCLLGRHHLAAGAFLGPGATGELHGGDHGGHEDGVHRLAEHHRDHVCESAG